MVRINLYKIVNVTDLESNLKSKEYKLIDYDLKNSVLSNLNCYCMYLYWNHSNDDIKLNWHWILEEFDEDINELLGDSLKSRPKAVLLIKIKDKDNNYLTKGYLVSFGHTFHDINLYIDKNWVLNFADKLNYDQIKRLTVLRPSSKNLKRTNTYTNYDNFDFNIGDILEDFHAYVNQDNLKIKKEIPNFEVSFNSNIEVGNSLKVTIKNDDLKSVAMLLDFIEYVDKQEDKQHFPISKEIKNHYDLENLNEILSEEIMNYKYSDDFCFDISEYFCKDILNSNINSFNYFLNGFISESLTTLNIENFKNFIVNSKIQQGDLLNIQVIIKTDEETIIKEIINFIFYNNPEKLDYADYFLINGIWQQYKQSYLSDLKKGINKLDVNYCEKFDLDNKKNFYNYFLKQKGDDSKDYEFFNEDHFNEYLSKYHGFGCYHKYFFQISNSRIEVMDLYKDETMFFVKISDNSGELCYAIDQSLSSLEALESGLLNKESISNKGEKKYLPKEIKKVCLWIVLLRDKPLKLNEGVPNLNYYRGFPFKQKLIYWNQEVRQKGYEGQIYINYKFKKNIKKLLDI